MTWWGYGAPVRRCSDLMGRVVFLVLAVALVHGCGSAHDAGSNSPTTSITDPPSSATSVMAPPLSTTSPNDLGPAPSEAAVDAALPTSSTVPVLSGITYEVQAGDSVFGIARLHCVDAAALVQRNGWAEGIDHPIFPGDIVEIPEQSCKPADAPTASSVPTTANEADPVVVGVPSPSQPAEGEDGSEDPNGPYAPYDWPTDGGWYAPFWSPGVGADDYDRYFGSQDECENAWEAFAAVRQLDVVVDSAPFLNALQALPGEPPAYVVALVDRYFATLNANKPVWRELYPRLSVMTDVASDPEYRAAWAPLDTPMFREAYYGLYDYLESTMCPFPWDGPVDASTSSTESTVP